LNCISLSIITAFTIFPDLFPERVLSLANNIKNTYYYL
jgi:hypothetical protein